MSRIICKCTLVVTTLALIMSPVWAANIGDQILPQDLKGKARYAVVYDNVSRDVNLTSGPASVSKMEYDSLYLRVHTDVGEVASLDIDLGGVDPSGGDLSYYVGAGLRLLAYDSDTVRLTMMAQIHYAPIDIQRSGENLDYDLLEIEGGAFLSRKLPVEKQLTLIPYIGPVVSVIRLDGDSRVGDSSRDFDAEEDTLIGVAAGITAHLREQHSMQLEMRYFDDFNFSVGVAIAF